MLRALLAERFNLAVHNGSAPMPAYVLKTVTGAAKLKPAATRKLRMRSASGAAGKPAAD